MTADKTLTEKRFVDRLAQAIGDPGSFLPRGDNYQESITRWSTRAALSVVTEHWNERLEAKAQKLDELAADIDAGRADRFTNTAALRHAARKVRALKEGQQ